MKRRTLIFFSFCSACLFLAFAEDLFAQDPNFQVILQLNNPSPYLSDWKSRSNTATLMVWNRSSSPRQVKILAEIYSNGLLAATTQPDKLAPRILQPGSTPTYFNGGDIVPIEAVKFTDNVDQTSQRLGRIPDGTICVKVMLVDASTLALLAQDYKCAPIITYMPPVLISPENETELCLLGLNNVVDKQTNQPRPYFRWTSTVPTPQYFPVTYHFAIFEVLPGQQPEAAFRSGRALFERDLNGITELLWPVEFFLPEVGKRYMWSVRALDDKNNPLVQTFDGWATPFYFHVADNCSDLTGSGIDINGDDAPDLDANGLPITLGGSSGNTNTGTGTLAVNIISPLEYLLDPLKDIALKATVSPPYASPIEFRWFYRKQGDQMWTAFGGYSTSPVYTIIAGMLPTGTPITLHVVARDQKIHYATDDHNIILTGSSGIGGNLPYETSAGMITLPMTLAEYLARLKMRFPKLQTGLVIGEHFAGWLSNVEGTSTSANMASPNEGGTSQPKTVTTEIGFKCTTGMSKDLYDWIQTPFGSSAENSVKGRQNGAIVFCDYDYNEISRLHFYEALVTEVGMPALDTRSKDTAKLSVRFKPQEYRISVLDSGKKNLMLKPIDTKVQKRWLPSNFRLKIDGLDEACRKVNKIEAIVVKQKVAENPTGKQRDYMPEPANIEIPNLVITLAESSSNEFNDWYKKFLSEGKCDQPNEKQGTLEYLADDLKTVLFTLTFDKLCLHALALSNVTGPDNTALSKAAMYIDGIRFSSSPAASFGDVLLPSSQKPWYYNLAAGK
jgi:hypothetical protein